MPNDQESAEEVQVFSGFERAAMKVAESINQIDAAIQSDADHKVIESLDEIDRIIAAGNLEDKVEAELNRKVREGDGAP